MPIAQRVAAAANGLRAADTAFAMDAQRISYGELARRAAAVAAGLASATPARRREWMPGDARLLAIGTGNHPTFAELFVGATAGNGACAVLDPQWAPGQAAAILRRLRPDVLVVAGTRSGLLETSTRLGIPTLVVGRAHAPDSYKKWMDQYAGADPREHLTAGDDTTAFLVGFTSGTTSVPKAFHRSRRSWRLSLTHGRSLWGMDATRHTLAPGPLAHGLSLYALAECLDVSAAFHSAARFDGTAVAQQLAADDIRRLVVAPTMLRALCAAAATCGVTLPRVDTVVSSAARLDPQLIQDIEQALPNARVTEYYGASEIGFITVRAPESGATAHDVGVPFPGVDIQLRDETGSVVPDGELGIVHVRSPLCCDGYLWGDDGRGYRTDGTWATVGDIGRRSPDGHLHLVGRDGMVVTGGLNVYVAEVEEALRVLPQIDEVVVTSVADAYLGRVLVAVVSGPDQERLSQSRLLDLCRPRLPRYKVPRRFYTVNTWPLTASGKIARGQIEEWLAYEDARLTPVPSSAADTDGESVT
jgi:acyl-CoA synthetase (AMP-forming)/AMP-acid ligase II